MYYGLISSMKKTVAASYTARTTAFIAATGISDTTIINALNTMDLSLISAGLDTKMKALYPFVGGTASTHKYNFMDARDLDAAFRIVFNGGWTHASTGAKPNGTNAYANSFLSPSAVLLTNSHSFGIYSRTNNVSGVQVYGCFYGSGGVLVQNNISLGNFISGEVSTLISYTANPSTSLLMASRTTSTLFTAYRGGISLGTNTSAFSTIPNFNFYFGARNDSGTPNLYSNHELAFGFLGSGLNSTEASALYNATQTFNTSLSRQI